MEAVNKPRKLTPRLHTLAALTAACLLISGCDQSPPPSNSMLGRPSSTVEQPDAAPARDPGAAALELALTSPESAAQLAGSSPEAVALATQTAAEQALKDLSASPESSMMKLTAYAQLAMSAKHAAPDSQTVREAADKAISAKAQAEDAISGKTP